MSEFNYFVLNISMYKACLNRIGWNYSEKYLLLLQFKRFVKTTVNNILLILLSNNYLIIF